MSRTVAIVEDDPNVRNLVRRNVEREKSSARYQRWIDDLKRKAMIDRKM